MAFPTAAGVANKSGIFIPEIWSGKLLVKFYDATVVAAISNTDYEGEITAMGDKVKIRIAPDMIIHDYIAGQPLQYTDGTAPLVELLIDKGKYFAVPINKVEQKQSDINFVDAWATDGSNRMKIAIDTDVLGTIYADAALGNYGATAGVKSASINLGVTGTPFGLSKSTILDKIPELGQILDEQSVPEEGRWLILPPWAITRLKQSALQNAYATGDAVSVLRNGKVGTIDRFEIYSSNLLSTVKDGSNWCTNILFGHKSALTFASQLVENETIPNPQDFGQLMRGLQVYGYKTVKPEALGRLYAYAT